MSIEAMKQALAALETCRIRSVSEWSVEDITPKNVTAAIAALRTAIQQAEAQQPDQSVNEKHFGDFELLVVTTAYEQGFGHAFRTELSNPYAPATNAYKAWDMGRSAGKRNGQPQQPATGEPVVDVRCEGCGYMTHHREHMGCVRAAKQHTHPAPSVPDDVVRDAERYRFILAAADNMTTSRYKSLCELLRVAITEDFDLGAAIDAAIQQAEAQQPVTGERLMGQVSLPDGSAFAIASFPLPKDHWLYAPREYATGAGEPLELPAPILTHGQREAVVAAIRYAVRGATMCGREQDFDPDAMVQNAVYALCGPYAP